MSWNTFDALIHGTGVNLGNTLVGGKLTIGGTRSVFVKLQGGAKNGLVFPTFGGLLANPFLGPAKIFAGDLIEYNPAIGVEGGATVKVLKTYEVMTAVSEGTEIDIVRNGFRHVPFVGDILMVAPDEIDGTGTATTVTAVSVTTNDDGYKVWRLTVDTAITADAGAILVEADSDGNPVVTNPNSYAPADYDFRYTPSTSDDDAENARYSIIPALANEDTILYLSKMSPLPDSVKALNQCKVEGWFHL